MKHYDVLQRRDGGLFWFRSLPEHFGHYNAGSGVFLSPLHEHDDAMCLAPYRSSDAFGSGGEED